LKPHRSSVRASIALALIGCAACAASTPLGTRPNSSPVPAVTRYEGTCAFVGIEEMQGYTDEYADTVFLVARYTWRDQEARPPRKPIELAFQVQRSRVDDFQTHLQHYPNVICRPSKTGGGEGSGMEVVVPPFEGQAGKAPPAALMGATNE
jgi:hypothetical protein